MIIILNFTAGHFHIYIKYAAYLLGTSIQILQQFGSNVTCYQEVDYTYMAKAFFTDEN
jgi:hypothetical protein